MCKMHGHMDNVTWTLPTPTEVEVEFLVNKQASLQMT